MSFYLSTKSLNGIIGSNLTLMLGWKVHEGNCWLNSFVYVCGFFCCFCSVMINALICIDFILYDIKKSIRFIVTYSEDAIQEKKTMNM